LQAPRVLAYESIKYGLEIATKRGEGAMRGFMWVLLILTSASFLVLPFNVRSVKASPGTIVVPDDFPTIQSAINAANKGDTVFVRAATYQERVFLNKTLVLMGEGRETTILNSSTADTLMTVEADNVSISGFTLEGWAFTDILVNSTTGAFIAENRIVFNGLGIDMENSSNATIENNLIEGNGLDNIGIMLVYSSKCMIMNNTITNAVYDGVRLWFSSNNSLSQNLIKDNDCGIYFHESKQNIVSENSISASGGQGIYVESSSGNEFYHNSFVGNYAQAMIYDSSANIWDDGSEGNYWSDYSTKYPNATQVGATWNTPYVIKTNNVDNHPLVVPEFPSAIVIFALILPLPVILLAKRKMKH
jgi:parallel beta-helix repeat protein